MLLKPNSRRRAGIETADAPKGELSTLDLLLALKHGDITREEYDQRMEPERARRAAELKDQGHREQLERISDASLNRIEALMVPPAH